MLSFFPLLISFNGLSGMSSLTNEQIKRIEENRAKALAKLAKKRATTNAPEQGNAACSSKTHLYHSSNVNKGQIHVFMAVITKIMEKEKKLEEMDNYYLDFMMERK